MRGIAAIGLLALAAPAAAQDAVSDTGLPAWMVGCWEMRDGARWAEECWMAPREGVMLGAGRSGRDGGKASWEAMQITVEPPAARGDAAPVMTFWASPNGTPRTPFTREVSDLQGVTFVNLENDYPQRVRYWREGDLLNAEISRADGSSPIRWSFMRAGGK